MLCGFLRPRSESSLSTKSWQLRFPGQVAGNPCSIPFNPCSIPQQVAVCKRTAYSTSVWLACQTWLDGGTSPGTFITGMLLETSSVACTKAKHQQLQLLHTPPGTSAFPIQLVSTWNNFAPQQSYRHTCNPVICPMGLSQPSCAILHEPPPPGIEPLCHLAARTSARLGIYCAAAASRSSTGAAAAEELRWNMWLSSTSASAEAAHDPQTQEQRQCHGRSWKRRKNRAASACSKWNLRPPWTCTAFRAVSQIMASASTRSWVLFVIQVRSFWCVIPIVTDGDTPYA